MPRRKSGSPTSFATNYRGTAMLESATTRGHRSGQPPRRDCSTHAGRAPSPSIPHFAPASAPCLRVSAIDEPGFDTRPFCWSHRRGLPGLPRTGQGDDRNPASSAVPPEGFAARSWSALSLSWLHVMRVLHLASYAPDLLRKGAGRCAPLHPLLPRPEHRFAGITASTRPPLARRAACGPPFRS